MLDLHTHVWPHGPGTPIPTMDVLAGYCEAAAAKGISEIAITEHSHRFGRIVREVFPHWERPGAEVLQEATDHVLQVEGGGDLDAYVDAVVDLAQSGSIDVLVHLDVVKVAGHRPSDIKDHEARLAAALADLDVVVEFSSAGLRKPAADLYPSTPLLDRLLEHGAVLTTASDAHAVDQIGFGFDRLEQELDALGVGALASFRKRKRVMRPI